MPIAGSPLGDYLRARRSLIRPEDVGLVSDSNRRVAGLRREEVAQLAGVSQEYYLRLEQGRDRQPSEQVLGALGRALRLDDAAVVYMLRLTRLQTDVGRLAAQELEAGVASNVQELIEQWSHTPAFVSDRNQDIVAANPLASALSPGFLEAGNNLLLLAFTEVFRQYTPGWEQFSIDAVASLRFNGNPFDARYQEVVGTLAIRDAFFREAWARYDAKPWSFGSTLHYVDGIGPVPMRFQNLDVPNAPGYSLTVFRAEPGSLSADAIGILQSRLDGEG